MYALEYQADWNNTKPQITFYFIYEGGSSTIDDVLDGWLNHDIKSLMEVQQEENEILNDYYTFYCGIVKERNNDENADTYTLTGLAREDRYYPGQMRVKFLDQENLSPDQVELVNDRLKRNNMYLETKDYQDDKELTNN